MSARLTDDDLHRLLRGSIADHADRLPTPTPSWERVRAGMAGVRRARRGRALLAAAVAALALFGAVRVGGATSERDKGLPAKDDRPRVSPVFGDAATVGSLAKDRGFLAAVRERVVDVGTFFGDRVPAGATTGDVLVPFAGDVGDLRLVLVEVELTGAEGTVDRFLWFDGPRGARAREVVAEEHMTMDSAQPTTSIWLPSPNGAPAGRGTGALVVLSALPGDVRVATGLRYAADGSAQWDLRAVPRASDRHWESTVAWTRSALLVPVGYYALPDGSAWLPMRPPVESNDNGPVPDRRTSALNVAQVATGLPVDGSARRVLWSGTLDGADVDVVAVTVPGGANVVTAVVGRVDRQDYVTCTRGLSPGPPEKIAFAWSTGATDTGRQNVSVLAPAGTARATVVTASGRVPVPLSGGAGHVTVEPGVSEPWVDFTDAAGTLLARAVVTPVNQDSSPLPRT